MSKRDFGPLYALLLLFIVAPVLAALVSPWVHMAIQSRSPEVLAWVQECEAAGTHAFWADIADSVFDSPLRRVTNRAVMIAILVFLVPAYRLSGLRGRADFGIPKVGNSLCLIRRGIFFAIISMLLIYLPGMIAGVFVWNPAEQGTSKILAELLKILLGAAFIGIFEEILFRGFILNALRKSLGVFAAVVLSSLLFAVVHFIKPVDPEITNRWYSGFLLGSRLFARAGDTFWPEVCTLFCMGTVLATISDWTRSVYVAIGLHTGWVWVMMLFRLFAENSGNMLWLYGTGEWISKAWIGPTFALIILGVVYLTRRQWQALGAQD